MPSLLKAVCLWAVFAFFSDEALAQNTKGDRPVRNQRVVRETKQKSYKRREKGTTRDVAGRRLRTRDKSSANRANAKYPQPQPYSRRINKEPERAARPRGKVFAKSPRESKRRDWRGDVAGHAIRRVIPANNDASPTNVYPQKSPIVKFYKKRPPEHKIPTVSRNTSGRPVGIKHPPRYVERAWKGGLDNGPIRNQSVTGKMKRTYSQNSEYVGYYRKKVNTRERPITNNQQLRQAKKWSRKPLTGTGIAGANPGSTSRPYVQRGRKNVYWGKFQRKERGTTTDLTGGPLRTRNYRSAVAGLLGRDTLKFFGRKPLGDRANRAAGGGFNTRTRKGQRGWLGDIAGFNLRKSKSGGKEKAGAYFFPRQLSISGSGERVGRPVEGKFLGLRLGGGRGRKQGGGGGGSISAGWNNNGKAIQGKSIGLARGLGGGRPRNKPKGGGGSISARWNNKGRAIQGKAPGSGYLRGARYTGSLRQGQPAFGREGASYSGNIRRGTTSGFSRQGAGYQGNIRRRGAVKQFQEGGIGFAGNIKSKRPQKGGGSIGGLWNNKNRAIQSRPPISDQGGNYSGNIRRRGAVKQFEEGGIGFSGNIRRRGAVKQFEEGGIGFAGNIKRKRPEKGGGSISGSWNNGNKAIQSRPPVSDQGGNYSGNIRSRGAVKTFEEGGVGFAGNIKTKRPKKGGGSVSGALWNNQNKALAARVPKSDQGGNYSGNIKFKRPEKGGGSVSGHLINNGGKAIEPRAPKSEQGGNYSGNIKFKRPEKGGGSVSGHLINNGGKPVDVRIPKSNRYGNYSGNIKFKQPEKGGGSVSGKLINNDGKPVTTKPETNARVNYTGKIALSRFKKNYVQNPNSVKESLKKKHPDETTYRVAGLQVKVREHANAHNPNSDDDALRGRSPGKAAARIRDFQGNVKMKKYSGGKLHPDAQFAHGFRDNVKEERTILMNVKLAWGKLFRKSETQPENLKVRPGRPRYDKREKGLWND